MFKFPQTEPKISVTELPGVEFEVECVDAQSGFVLLAPGADAEFAFYDHPEGKPASEPLVFTGAHRLKVGNRILIEGVEAFETDWWYADPGSDYADRSGTTYDALDKAGLRTIAWIQRHNPEMWAYETYDMTPIPGLLKPGLKVVGHERVTVGQDLVREREFTVEVMGAAELSIGPKTYRCLKVRSAWYDGDKPDSLAEYYVADTGRTVYFRRYDGPGSGRYAEKLQTNPTLDHAGVTWRHFYNCLPDHALIVGL